jgi:hypothetical protein
MIWSNHLFDSVFIVYEYVRENQNENNRAQLYSSMLKWSKRIIVHIRFWQFESQSMFTIDCMYCALYEDVEKIFQTIEKVLVEFRR